MSTQRDARGRFVAANGNGSPDGYVILGQLLDRMASRGVEGTQYSGRRDLYSVGGYKETLGIRDYLAKYERDGIAAQIVDRAAETTWRAPPEVVEPETDDDTPFMVAWREMAERLGVWSKFEEAHSKARLGRFAVAFIGTAGGDDRTLELPLTSVAGPEAVLYLSTFDELYVDVQEWDADVTSERYGKPLIYAINFSGNVPSFGLGSGSQLTPGKHRVHHTRVLHVSDGDVYGRPVLKRVWNDLEDLRKITTSSAEAFWQRVAGILGLEIDKDAKGLESQLAEIDSNLSDLYHDLKRVFAMRGGRLYRVADTEPNPEAAADLCMTLIAAGATPPTPKRMLFGSETGERASTEDQKTWLGSISELDHQFSGPRIVRPFVQRMIDIGALPPPSARKFELVWPTRFQVPEKDVAEANALRARAIKDVTPMGGDPTLLYEVDKDRNIWPKPRTADEPSPFEMLEPEPALPGGGEDDEPEGDQAA